MRLIFISICLPVLVQSYQSELVQYRAIHTLGREYFFKYNFGEYLYDASISSALSIVRDIDWEIETQTLECIGDAVNDISRRIKLKFVDFRSTSGVSFELARLVAAANFLNYSLLSDGEDSVEYIRSAREVLLASAKHSEYNFDVLIRRMMSICIETDGDESFCHEQSFKNAVLLYMRFGCWGQQFSKYARAMWFHNVLDVLHDDSARNLTRSYPYLMEELNTCQTGPPLPIAVRNQKLQELTIRVNENSDIAAIAGRKLIL